MQEQRWKQFFNVGYICQQCCRIDRTPEVQGTAYLKEIVFLLAELPVVQEELFAFVFAHFADAGW